jgi:hypothetical protein
MSGRLLCRVGICVILLVALMGLQACSNEDPVSPPKDEAPTLPDMSTMTMDLSFFDQAQVDQTSIEGGTPTEMMLAAQAGKDNFINAAVRVFYVQLTFWAALEAPVAAFALALHSVPQHQDDGSWLWTYIFVDGEIEYSIFLYGIDAGDRTQWRMEVSTNDPSMPLNHFVWFTGEAMKGNTSGYWQFFEPQILMSDGANVAMAGDTPGVQSIRIDWLNAPGDIHQLTVLNNMPGAEEEGDNVVAFESPAMCYIEFTDVSVPETGNITWYADGSGYIHVPDYNNYEKACWDTNQDDVACP